MYFLYLVMGAVCVGIGALVARRRDAEPRLQWVGWGVLAAGMAVILMTLVVSPGSRDRRYVASLRRQGYALGFGLGQYLKQTQPGRSLVLLRGTPEYYSDPQTVAGLKDGLDGALKIVAERQVDISKVKDFHSAAAVFTSDLLMDLKSTGADTVVSFVGFPYKMPDFEGSIDQQATLALWRSPEYSALQWVLTRPALLWPSGMFREGRVLAVVRDKPQAEDSKEAIPAYLETKGTPAELFNAWFELITTDTDQ